MLTRELVQARGRFVSSFMDRLWRDEEPEFEVRFIFPAEGMKDLMIYFGQRIQGTFYTLQYAVSDLDITDTHFDIGPSMAEMMLNKWKEDHGDSRTVNSDWS